MNSAVTNSPEADTDTLQQVAASGAAASDTTSPGAAPAFESVTLASGRRVAVRTLATGSGARTVVFCHPTPGSGAFDPDPERTARRDVTLLAVDRPGYGESAPVGPGEWASVPLATADIAEVLSQRGITSVGVVGWSSGGRVALALAAQHPELVDRVVLVGTPAPHDEVPWIPEEHAAGLEALRGIPPEQVQALLEEQFAPTVPADPAAPDALAMLGVAEADDAALSLPGARARLAGMMTEAFRQGAAGVAADIAGHNLAPWGFEPEQVRARTLLLYGGADPVAGGRHARWWAAHINGARIEMAPDAGHMLILPKWERILSHLAPGSVVKGR